MNRSIIFRELPQGGVYAYTPLQSIALLPPHLRIKIEISYSPLGLNRTSLDQIDNMADMSRGDYQDWRLVAIDYSCLIQESSSVLTISHVQLCPLERYHIACPTS